MIFKGSDSEQVSDGYDYIPKLSKATAYSKHIYIIPYSSSGGGYSFRATDGKRYSGTYPDTVEVASISSNTKLPFKVSQGSNGSTTITDFKISDGKAYIKVTIDGYLPASQLDAISLGYAEGLDKTTICLNRSIKKISKNKYEFSYQYGNLISGKAYKVNLGELNNIDCNSKIDIPIK